MATKVLITGAGGFVGAHLVRDQLARGRGVVALDLQFDALKDLKNNSDLEMIDGDIRSREVLNRIPSGINIVFHLASAHLEVTKSEGYFHDVNVGAASSLVSVARERGAQRFVHCSTVGVFGPLEKIPADESSICHPDIAYERTKLEGEEAVRATGDAEGLSYVILRPAWIYGPGCPRTLKLFRTIKKRRFVTVGDGSNYRHPVYISDMLKAFELATVAAEADSEMVIVAGEKAVPVKSLISLIIETLGMRYRPLRLPIGAVSLACMGIEKTFSWSAKEPPVSSRSLKFFTDSSAFRIDKARRVLGYSPEISLSQGLRKTYEYYTANGLL